MVLIGACLAVQIALGANPLVLALALIACVAGLVGFRIAGAYHAGGYLALFFILGNVVVALVAKTALLQPLDSRLHAPTESFLILVAGSTTLLIALLVSLMIPVGKTVFSPVRDVHLLRWISHSAFALGTLFWYLNRLSQDSNTSAFGGFAVFWNLLLMAVIARTAMVLERSVGRRSVDTPLFVILTACVMMGLIDNSKAAVALPVVAHFATALFYRGGLSMHQTATAALGIILMVGVVGPVIHAVRTLGIHGTSFRERGDLIQRGIKETLVKGHLEHYTQLLSAEFLTGHYDYFGEGRGQMLLGRFASIQQIDPVIATVKRQGTMGGAAIWPSFARVAPSFIHPDKPRYIEAYGLLVSLGLIPREGGRYPSVPLLAQSYAGYGVVGLLLIPFLTFLGFLLALKKLGWRLHRNVFAIFFSCVFVVIYASQGDLGHFAETTLRNFPVLAIVLWLLIRVPRPVLQ